MKRNKICITNKKLNVNYIHIIIIINLKIDMVEYFDVEAGRQIYC